MEKVEQKVEISHRTIIFSVFFLFSLYFLFQIREILVFLFIAIIFMSALNPVIDRLEKFKIHRDSRFYLCIQDSLVIFE